ncbi:hypothetical protein LPJ77_000444 [Coemansia sp. RSA 2523]|nr:hypothetical protein LPJ54_004051 [Coemansia sp. RSA 1824]KAJ1811015.1 hypothetical protein LPJ77_000444 [Coemansia sp. RSA 2523]KAJ2133572.1 hypothetical protein GGF48_000075 [Coemansia sp. RSA 921]KAJ2148732.1 hypothetical protein IW142_000666 [Coemansia sp. RSA 564]KAJ2155394.1 hypothetical protein J3F82_000359 [Coemansia sp. RSA 637]KAJ2229819.1 hypothetical protein EV180_001301 [Coemansia sp. RSA 518]KAJ2282081.1 hypothetical protein EV176_000024 [Coemansia sp. RSA 451]KAJ2530470.1 h
MSTNLDQSLDDIIKSTPRSSGSGGRGRRDGNSRGQTRNSPYARRSGGVQKSDSGSRKPSQQQQQQAAQMMMLNNPAYLAALQQQHRQKQGSSASSGKILINNLDYGVTEADLRELFQQVGALSKVALNFNRRGTSSGSGMVIFKNPAHAQSAYNRYNNVELDHRKMLIEVVGGGAASGVVPMVVPMMPQNFVQPQNASGARRNRRGNAQGSSSGQGNKSQGSSAQGSNGNAQGGRRRGGRQDKPQPSAEQLDADLDEYMKDANNAS